MECLGRVVGVNGDRAEVLVQRHSACSGCHKCAVGSESADFVTQVENTVKAEPGQMVSLEMGESNILLASFVSYFIPFLGFLAGTALTAWLLPGNELRLFLGGLAGIGLVYLVVHYWYQPRVAKKGFVKIEIKRVI